MPVTLTSCTLLRPISASSDKHGMGTYRLRWQAEVAGGSIGPRDLIALCQAGSPHAVPQQWATYSYPSDYGTDADVYSYAQEFQVTNHEQSKSIYYIDVTYSPLNEGEGSQTVGGSPIESVTNPVSRAPVMWWDREVFTHYAQKDINGKAIVNKCQDFYPNDIEIEATRGVLVIEKNYATLAEVIDLSQKYDGAVNSSLWNVHLGAVTIKQIAAKQALCREVSSGPPQTERGYVYFPVRFRFALKDTSDTWDEKMPEYGQFTWIKTTGGSYETIQVGGDTHRALKNWEALVKLNDDGTRRDQSQDAIFTPWEVRRKVDFNALGF